ncbi:hypothetical protein ENKNEFLB_02976 [Nocardioides aquaticus]|uniref:Nuclear transport factor 2 family protein n=2 Tax=Nocardioides aquaticus TaxID=160826 RepID=A0ABX8EJ86_9ACTN|nr:hypothetical protein [Nocardioides aquaticus]QVT80577.1 hypothetical protein ENKNEFLB_02976 [Nocardioides aquaticus]
MRHLDRRPSTHVRSRVPRLAAVGSGLAALLLAAVALLSATGAPGGGELLGLGPGDPEPRLATPGAPAPGTPESGEDADAQQALAAGPAPVRAPPPGGAAAPGAVRWSAGLLRAWDRARERAWQAADPGALAALYVAGSTAGERDAELMERWRSAGVEVRSLRLRVETLDVVALDRRRVVLEVTDRLRVDAVAEGAPGVLRLGRDRPSTRVVELRRDGGTWQVAGVVPAGTA